MLLKQLHLSLTEPFCRSFDIPKFIILEGFFILDGHALSLISTKVTTKIVFYIRMIILVCDATNESRKCASAYNF